MDIKIFTNNIEQQALDQINALTAIPVFSDSKIRIMPDVHAGAGCVIGFTANLGERVIPNIVGVDIGCGMLTIKLADKLDEGKLRIIDETIHQLIPAGRNYHDIPLTSFPVKSLRCYSKLRNKEIFNLSIGTLGGGNHFIEIDCDEDGVNYLVIHTGSRNLGKQVADYYQKLAIHKREKEDLKQECDALVKDLKSQGKEKEIYAALQELKANYIKVPKELCWLEGQDRDNYLYDMMLCQQYAIQNRATIANIILSNAGLTEIERFETIHNYIEPNSNMVRKGAIAAYEDEYVLIPLNMRDGCILGKGKGNPDWNYSAPHGAGRIMSRAQAKKSINLEEYEHTMEGIYTTSVNEATIDEAPFAYKPAQEIIDYIQDTVEIVKILKPIYNFKASE